ncbi:hypothetical protein SESBI_20509 [Sesbania bispinosa]|nr:hypothetical protein SESBI_20509 [Sesbania bispinosa]
MDLNLKGCKFMWVSNPREGQVTREKLDRVLVNWIWRQFFPHASAVALPAISSDHSPLVIQINPNASSGRMFRFEAFWEEHPECFEVVYREWRAGMEAHHEWGSILNNINACRLELEQWHVSTFKRPLEEIHYLKQRL